MYKSFKIGYNVYIRLIKTIMKIKYIIDRPYEGKYVLTDARDGASYDITKEVAKDLRENHSHECFFSAPADVNLRSVSISECLSEMKKSVDALNELSATN